VQHERRRRRCASRGVASGVFPAGRSLFLVVLCGYVDAVTSATRSGARGRRRADRSRPRGRIEGGKRVLAAALERG
jgi:hypothetical protein